MMAALFDASFLLVAPFWLLMIALPRWRVTQRVIASPWIVVPAAALYLALVLPGLSGLLATVSSPSLEVIASMLGTPEGATVAWLHFLAFDLFVGRWIYLDARERGMTPWIASPLLFLTLMLGPTGLLGHLLVRGRFHGPHGATDAASAPTREQAPRPNASPPASRGSVR